MRYKTYSFHIDEVQLTNFRMFDSLTVTLERDVTVLTAPNGGGKSALLRALAVGCAHFVNNVVDMVSPQPGITDADHRLIAQKGGGMTPAEGDAAVSCRGEVCGKEMQWSRERSFRPNARTRVSKAVNLQEAARGLRRVSAQVDLGQSEEYPVVPLIAYYDTDRLNRETKLTEKRKIQRADRFDGFTDCLYSGSYMRIFKNWFRDISFQLWQASPNSDQYRMCKNQMQVVCDAVDAALEHVGWHHLHWNSRRNALMLDHPEHGTLCVEQLSDGVRNVLNLVTDVAHRAARLNPMVEENLPQMIQGLVMIDEIDMCLHPSWQQRIVGVLHDFFPNLQWVITTHSPQVLSTVQKRQIRMLYRDEKGRYGAGVPDRSPYARAASESLRMIFGVPEIPEVKETRRIVEMEQLYRLGETERADALREQLLENGVEVPDADIRFWKLWALK